MRVFAINLAHRADKRTTILTEARKYNILVEIIDAVNGNAISDEEIQTLAHDYPQCALTKGTIGCALSHLSVYKKMIDEGIECALVLEDDAILSSDLPDVLCQLQKLPSISSNDSPEVYLLSSHYYRTQPTLPLNEKYAVHKFMDGSQAHAYVLNLKAAKSLYENLRPVKWEADKWYYFEQLGLIHVNCVVPHVVKVNGVPSYSDLQRERSTLTQKRRQYLIRLKRLVSMKEKVRKIFWKAFKRPFVKKS